NLVAKALPHLRDSEWHAHARAIADVLEVDEDSLSRFWPQECSVFLRPQRPNDRLEHQVEVAGFGKRAETLGVWPQNFSVICRVDLGQTDERTLPCQIGGILGT